MSFSRPLFGEKNRVKATALATGKSKEDFAERYLQAKGLRTVAKNYRCRRGEIDLIMRENDTVVFVEVRFRQSDQFGSALDTVTKKKQDKIRIAAQHYMLQKKINDTVPIRFDVIGITRGNVQWVTAAF